MIDIHNHLLFGVDDGSDSFELSLKLLKEAQKEGINDIILTPHYIKNGDYKYKANVIKKVYEVFREHVKKHNIKINLYLGNELYIHEELDNLLQVKEVLSLNDSKYVLVEFPFTSYRDEYDEILYNITTLGYKIIIAHPERYKYVKENHKFIKRWVDNGYLLQVNQNSLNKKDLRAMIFDWIHEGYLYFIASDAHNEYRPCTLKNAYDIIVSKFDEDIANRIFIDNPKCIINNETIAKMPIIKKKLFGLF